MSVLLRVAALCLLAPVAHAQIALTGTPVQENFDSLVSTGTGTAANLPAGWAFVENTANTTYTANDGSANSGDTYSAGSTGSTERAFGSLASNTTQSTIGAQYVNQTGNNIGQLTLQYTGEQWRAGGSGNVDKLSFAYSTDATSLSTGTWTPVTQLDFTAPIQGASIAVLNGNLAANQANINYTITGLSIGTGQTFWIRWSETNIAGADDLLAIDNLIVSTTGGVDVAPTITNTVPANNATAVQPAANLSVQFSEAVTTNAGWFALSCSSSGAVSVSESGSGATRTIDPVPTLVFGEVCTASVTAANVLDTDGTPDPMAANYQWSFTVVSDTPPTVSTTTPANGVASVPVNTNVQINFSEPVSTSGSWYSIVCANSGAHPAVVSGGPSSYTLNPDTDFDLLEQCTVTLTAALILDQDGTPDPLGSNYVFSFTTAASASNYYANVDASNPTVLRTTLHATIDDHQSFPYSNGATCNIAAPTPANCDVWDMVETGEQNPANPAQVLDIYRNRAYAKGADRAGTGSGLTYNREHSWPNSLGFNDVLTLDGFPYGPYTDGHMLFASDTQYNADRGNKPFDNCDASCTELVTLLNNGGGGTSGTYPGDSNWVRAPDGNTGTFEVWRKRKGDLARAILYMDVRYEGGTHANGQREPDLIVTNNRSLLQITPSGQYAAVGYMAVLDTLIAWHQADPPDAQEVLRNEVIYSFQGNRNPFIDHPEWVACLFQNQCTAGENVFANGFE